MPTKILGLASSARLMRPGEDARRTGHLLGDIVADDLRIEFLHFDRPPFVREEEVIRFVENRQGKKEKSLLANFFTRFRLIAQYAQGNTETPSDTDKQHRPEQKRAYAHDWISPQRRTGREIDEARTKKHEQ